MAHAVTDGEFWVEDCDAATGPYQKQWARLTITAANTDTDWDFGDTNGTFWAAADGTTAGAAAESAFDQLAIKAKAFLGIYGDVHLSYSHGAAAAATVYTMSAGANFAKCPNLTFNSGNAPTSIDFYFCWLLKSGETGLEFQETD